MNAAVIADASVVIGLDHLPSHSVTIHDTVAGRALKTLFAEHAEVPGVIVTDEHGALVGAISRSRFMELQSQPFWRDIYHKRPVSTFIEQCFDQPLVLAETERVDVATERALQRPGKQFSEPLVIHRRDGSYALLETQVVLTALTRVYAEQNRRLQTAQDSLVQSEKMASLGNLVAGIAHEINTPLGIGVTAISYLQDRVQAFQGVFAAGNVKKADLQNVLAAVLESAQLGLQNLHRAADLVRSFKQVAVDQTSEARRQFDLAEVLQEALTSLKPAIKRTRITVQLDVPSCLTLDSYPGALVQVVTNLVMNAINHGFTAEQVGKINLHARVLANDQVEIGVIDDGMGISPENLSKIFEPFFTTKRGQGGTGLGLHIVYNIVASTLRGRIDASSVLGQGARFLITIPLSAEASQEPEA